MALHQPPTALGSREPTKAQAFGAAVLIAAMISGCTPKPNASPCLVFRWIEIPEADEPTVSPELVEQIRAHDQAWLETCEP